MAKLISRSSDELQLAVCISRGDGKITMDIYLTSLRNKSQKTAWATFSTNIWLKNKLMCTAII